MKKLFPLIFISLFTGGILSAQSVKPYDKIGEMIKQNSSSAENPTYKVPCGSKNVNTYLQSAITVGDAVTDPVSYFSTTAPGAAYINFSTDIATVERGKTFNWVFTVNKNTTTTTTTAYVHVFADLNRDGVFETKLGTLPIEELTTNETPGVNMPVTMPANAPQGKTRVRVYLTTSDTAPATADSNVTSGYIYDFIFFISETKTHTGLLVAASTNNTKLGAAIISTASPTNDGRYAEGGDVTVQATLTAENTTFIGWSDGTRIISKNTDYTFTVTKPTYLIAVFKTITATLEAPQTSTADKPIWYQIKNAQTDARLNCFISYDTSLRIEKPEDFTGKFLWRLEPSTGVMIKFVNKGSGKQIYAAAGTNNEIVTVADTGSDFSITPSGNINGSYTLKWNDQNAKFLNGGMTFNVLIYNAGVGTGSGWYFYRVPDSATSVSSHYFDNPNIRIYTRRNQINIAGVEEGDVIDLYNMLGHKVLTFTADNNTCSRNLDREGLFLVTITNKEGRFCTRKILK